MKRIIILLLIIIPIYVKAGTSANGTGGTWNTGGDGGSSGGGNNTGSAQCVYFLQNDYGVRVSFYSSAGNKMGRSVDVYSNTNSPSCKTAVLKDENKKALFSIISCYYTQWKHGSYDSKKNLKSRIDYINSGMKSISPSGEYNCSTTKVDMNCMLNSNYYLTKRYFDMKSPKYKSSVGTGDPLLYASDEGNVYLKDYFTRKETILNYAKLADASITEETIAEGNYFLLLEPILHLEVVNCPQELRPSHLQGYYTSTEFKLLKNSDTIFNTSERLRTIPVYIAARLAQDQSLGEKYHFLSESNLFEKNKNYQPSTSKLTLQVDGKYYGYGMMLIEGSEVESYVSKNNYRIIYHSIDLEKPFLTVDGKIRTLDEKSNWYNKQNIIDKNIYKKDPFLVVTLTPEVIKSIRKDNKNINYASLNATTYSKFKETYNSYFKFATQNND